MAVASVSTAGLLEAMGVVARLRDPNGGCPWDLKQTHASLKRYLLEEAYEALEAIDNREVSATPATEAALADELGDVLLQVLLHCQLASERGSFDMDAVAQGLADKLVRRHPHVFGDSTATTSDAVVQQWDAIKATEKAQNASDSEKKSVLGDVPKEWPALVRAAKLSKRAVKVGFAWPHEQSLWDCVMSEVDEFRHETQQLMPSADRLEDEMGDILFAMVSLANHYGVDAETALARGNAKFTQRFTAMEQLATQPLGELSFEQWDDLWKQAKAQRNSQP